MVYNEIKYSRADQDYLNECAIVSGDGTKVMKTARHLCKLVSATDLNSGFEVTTFLLIFI